VPLERVRVEAFRCIGHAELLLHEHRNYIYGANGAGKPSLLEAIYLLGRGRSFRTRQNKRLIAHGQPALSVYGETIQDGNHHRLGVRLSEAGLETRLDGASAGGIAALARRLPAHVIEPNIHQLVEGGPSKRRRFLDWGVFHVEHGFLEAWRRFRRVLGQRNAALKRGLETRSWDDPFIEAGSAVHAARQRYFNSLQTAVTAIGRELTGRGVSLGYRSGWLAAATLAEALEKSRDRDRQLGATQVGPHRADLSIMMDERGVREEASRGQQKLVAAALVLGQVQVFADAEGYGGVLLVDDPAAELDAGAFACLMAALETVPAQLIMTGLSEAVLPPAEGFPVFHVKQGTVSAVV
jgi:DNA replication and repair protein RecF